MIAIFRTHQPHFSTAFAGVALTLVTLSGLGCGRGESRTVPVSGVVRLGGEPLEGVMVRFHPEKGQMAFGRTDDDGRFRLTTRTPNDGALPGRYAVTVIETEPPPPVHDGSQVDEAYAEPELETPFAEKYTRPDETTLSARVAIGRDNVFEFDLER